LLFGTGNSCPVFVFARHPSDYPAGLVALKDALEQGLESVQFNSVGVISAAVFSYAIAWLLRYLQTKKIPVFIAWL